MSQSAESRFATPLETTTTLPFPPHGGRRLSKVLVRSGAIPCEQLVHALSSQSSHARRTVIGWYRLRIARRSAAGLIVAVLSFMAQPAEASLISLAGDVGLIALPPASTKEGALESDGKMFVFVEREHLLLPDEVRVNFASPGVYSDRASTPSPVPRISAGVYVDSFYLHGDPLTSSVLYEGALTFDAAILGVLVGSELLDESDLVLGAARTDYPDDPFQSGRGLALNGRDTVGISADGHTLTFSIVTRRLIDQLRIVTASQPAAVPEPSMLLLAAVAALCAGRRVGLVTDRARRRGRYRRRFRRG